MTRQPRGVGPLRTRPLRVLLVGSFGLGIKATLTARAAPLGRALQRLGLDVRLVFVPWDCPAEAGRRFNLDGLPAVGLPRSARTAGPLFHGEHTLRLAGWLARDCRRHRPDIVHVFKPKAYGAAIAMALATLRRWQMPVPRVVVDTDDWEGAGGWATLEARRSTAPAWQRALASWQEPTTLRAAAAVTVASQALATLAWSRGVAPARVNYLPNALEAVEVARLGAVANQRAVAPTSSDEPQILLYSRLFEFAPERLADALARLRSTVPAVRLVVLGEALRGEDCDLRTALDRAGVSDMVRWVGWPGREAAPTYFAEATLALVPFDDHLINRTRSSFKVLELMGAGLPIVAEAVGQNAVCLEAGRSGWLVEPDDAAGLAAACRHLLEHPAEAAALGQAARHRVITHFTWEQQAPQLADLYRRVLAER